MKAIFQLTKRNLWMFFRNKTEVFFSFLSVLIILGLYILFLSDLNVNNVIASIGREVDGIRVLINSWVMAGLIAVSTVTISIGSLSLMVLDRQRKVFYDFLVAPIKRHELFLSYILSTLTIVIMISMTILMIAQVYILVSGGVFFEWLDWVKIILIILLLSVSSTMMMLFFISFIDNASALSTIGTIVGTLIGFVTGAYIPMGVLPKPIQVFSNLLPVSQGASLLRNIFVRSPLKTVFDQAPEEVVESYRKFQGIDLYIYDFRLDVNMMILYILIATLIFLFLNVLRFRKMKN